MFRYKTVRTFHFSSMEGSVFKSYSSFFVLPYIWTTSLSCSNLEVVKGSVLRSRAVRADQGHLNAQSLHRSDSGFGSSQEGQWIEEPLNLPEWPQLSFSYLSALSDSSLTQWWKPDLRMFLGQLQVATFPGQRNNELWSPRDIVLVKLFSL